MVWVRGGGMRESEGVKKARENEGKGVKEEKRKEGRE